MVGDAPHNWFDKAELYKTLAWIAGIAFCLAFWGAIGVIVYQQIVS